MSIRRVILSMTVLMFLAGGACGGSSSSSSLETAEIFADLVARAYDTGFTEVVARLRSTPPLYLTDVVLNGGDRLKATQIDPVTLAEDEKTMRKRASLGDVRYVRYFETVEKDTIFEVAFDRSSTNKVSANDSSATLPVPFVLDWVDDPVALTPAPDPFSRSSASPYYVVWDPFDAPDFEPGDELDYEVTGDCIETFEGVLDWQGGEDVLELTGVLLDRPPPDDGLSCLLRVEIRLSRMGTVDPAFVGGSFWGEQLRVLELESLP